MESAAASARRLARRDRLLLALTVAAFTVGLVALALDVSYNGRQDLVGAQRMGCFRGARQLVRIVNFDREEQQVNARLAKIGPVASLNAYLLAAAAREDKLLKAIDRGIDPSAWPGLNPIGRSYVERLGGRAFSCRRAYPAATFRVW